MKNIINFGLKKYIAHTLRQWDESIQNPIPHQLNTFLDLIQKAASTQFGKQHSFKDIHTYQEFCEAVPLRTYEDFSEYMEQVKAGEKDILFPGKPEYFAKTSGTTSQVKLIPLTKDYVKNFSTSGLNVLFNYIRATQNYDIVYGRNMLLQGSPELEELNGIKTGRMSGISYHILPQLLKKNRLPSYANNTIPDWEEKIKAIVKQTAQEDLRILGGIPPWIMMYFDYLSEETKEQYIKNIFPNLQLYIHGGVNFNPYRNLLVEKIGRSIDTLDTYTASEGFLGFQTDLNDPTMTLCTNSGIFYEFVELDQYRKNKHPKRIPLEEVELNTNYVIVLNTHSGLYGYVIGDTIQFTQQAPYKFVITGRVTQYISMFGEHLIAIEAEKALEYASQKFKFKTQGFTVAPNLKANTSTSQHEWWIAFEKVPEQLEQIAFEIDQQICKQNHLYADLIEGKVISRLKIIPIQQKGFETCLLNEGKIDGQNKIPTLSNHRDFVDLLAPYRL